jgi:ABC-2 type transport system permease protein
MPVWAVIAAQLAVTFVVATLGAGLVVALGWITYEVGAPEAIGGVIAAFVLGGLAFAAIGVLLGAVIPTARAAQGAGIILWFSMLILGGAGPPPEVLTDGMRAVADYLPLTHVIVSIQDPWLGFGWNGTELLLVAAILVVCALAAWRFFRWD